MNDQTKKLLGNILKPIITIIIALFIGVLLILPTGTSPIEAYGALFKGAFGSVNSIYNTLARSTPLIFTGLAAAFAFKSGVFNIGIEGQLYMGAMAAALTGVYLGDLPAPILIPACLVAAMIAGMLWAAIPGILKTRLDINIIISCIMMNSIAQLFTDYLATYPFKGELPIGATAKIAEGAMLPRLGGRSELNLGFILAILIAILLYIVIFKTRFG
ncbi:MAG: ABC transporter permease, partial [Niameybacter sp.]